MGVKKKINLLPKSEFEKGFIGKIFLWALTVGRYIVIGTELIVVIAFVSRFKLDRDLVNLNESIEKNQAIIESFAELEDNFLFLQQRLKTTAVLEEKQLKATSILDRVSALMPQDVSFVNFNLDHSVFDAEAVALSDQSIATFVNGLQSRGSWGQIEISNLMAEGEGSPNIEFEFRVELEVKSEEEPE